jgi:hypothetical protein
MKTLSVELQKLKKAFDKINGQGNAFLRLYFELNSILPIPEDLQGILRIAERTNALNPKISQYLDGQSNIKDWFNFTQLLQLIDPTDWGDLHMGSGDTPHKMRGHLEDAPLYSFFWFSYETQDTHESEVFDQLQALLIASTTLSNPKIPLFSQIQLYQCSILLRDLIHTKAVPLLNAMNEHLKTPASFYSWLNKLVENDHSMVTDREAVKYSTNEVISESYFEKRLNRLGILRDYLNTCWQIDDSNLPNHLKITRKTSLRNVETRQHFGTPIGTDHQIWKDFLALKQLQKQPSGDPNLIFRPPNPSDNEQSEDKASGEDQVEIGIRIRLTDIDESSDTPDIDKSRRDQKPTKAMLEELVPAATLWAQSRAIANRISLSNQRLITSTACPLDAEIARILEILNQLYKNPPNVHIKGKNQKQSADLIKDTLILSAIMINAGVSASTAISGDLIPTKETSEKNIFGWTSKGMWFKKINLIREQGEDKQHVDWIVYPDGSGLVKMLINTKPVFDLSTRDYEKIFQKAIKPRLLDAGVREQWARFNSLEKMLWTWYTHRVDGAFQSTGILYNQQDNLSNTQRFYSKIPMNRMLRSGYLQAKAISNLSKNWQLAEGSLFNYKFISKEDCKTIADRNFLYSIGDELCPSTDTVVDLIKELKSECMKSPRPDETRFQYLMRIHNARTLYTAVLFYLVSGARHILTPVYNLRSITSQGWLSLQEKDRESRSHSRLVLIPHLVRKQIHFYLEHTKALLMGQPLNEPTTMSLNGSKRRDIALKKVPLNQTFFLLPNIDEPFWYPTELSGSEIRKRVGHAAWEIDNANRHFLRTWLLNHPTVSNPDTNIDSPWLSAVHIDALFGHWHRGCEAWGKWSSLTPLDLKQRLEPILNNMLDTLKAEVIPFSIHGNT